jgi:pimeloyl-ACP methyl ester carboxylesterase
MKAAEMYWAGSEPDLDAITVPMLVMNGELDQLAPTGNADYLASRIGDNAGLEIDPGKLHCWFIEHADRFFSLMEEFLGAAG